MRTIFFPALSCILLTLCFTSATAQKKRQARDSSVTIIFSETTTARQKKKSSGDENIIKIAPLGFVGGVFPILYERRINDFLTVEVAGGLTNRNYIRGAFLKEEGTLVKEYPWNQTSGGDDEAEPMYSFDYRKPAMGFMYRVMPKIYFEEEAPDGNYVGLQYNFLKYKFTIPKYEGGILSGGHTGSPVNEYENVTDYMVFFGKQLINDRITFETASGIGMRKVNGMKYVATNNNGVVTDGLAPYKQSTFNFGLSFTVGYHF